MIGDLMHMRVCSVTGRPHHPTFAKVYLTHSDNRADSDTYPCLSSDKVTSRMTLRLCPKLNCDNFMMKKKSNDSCLYSQRCVPLRDTPRWHKPLPVCHRNKAFHQHDQYGIHGISYRGWSSYRNREKKHGSSPPPSSSH